MSRAEGSIKTGGRKKGTPNKSSERLQDQLAELKLDVPKEIANTLSILEPELKIKALMDLMGYLYPKRKAIEHSGEVVSPQPNVERELTAEEEKVMHSRTMDDVKHLIELDDDIALIAIKTIVRMKSARTISSEGHALLVNAFSGQI